MHKAVENHDKNKDLFEAAFGPNYDINKVKDTVDKLHNPDSKLNVVLDGQKHLGPESALAEVPFSDTKHDGKYQPGPIMLGDQFYEKGESVFISCHNILTALLYRERYW
jgi:hypothetical protein